MPTGYTAEISKGQSFFAFATGCINAFGATIDFRDNPDERPETMTVAPYYYEALEKAKEELLEIDSKTEMQHKMDAHDLALESIYYNEKQKEEYACGKSRLELMLAEVETWTPPKGDYHKYKAFMIDQIKQTIDFDYGKHGPYLTTGITDKYLNHKEVTRVRLLKNIAYCEKNLREQTERVRRNNEWIHTLVKSLSAV